MEQQVDLSKLTPEQKEQLRREFEEEEKAAEFLKEEERKVYKELASKSVDDAFDSILSASTALSLLKGDVYKTFWTLVNTKIELYDVNDTQQSHTWTNPAGDRRITIGFRVYDRWDDTANVGIAKIKDYLGGLAKDKESAKIMSIVNSLLKKDDKGNLKPSRVLELIALKKEIDDPLFTDGVGIIEKSHFLEKSRYYIAAEWQDDDQKWNGVPLSVSSVDFPSEIKKELFPENTKAEEKAA